MNLIIIILLNETNYKIIKHLQINFYLNFGLSDKIIELKPNLQC